MDQDDPWSVSVSVQIPESKPPAVHVVSGHLVSGPQLVLRMVVPEQ